MVSTSGAQLLPQDAVHQLCKHLLPLTTVLTPNIPEAILILSENGLSSPSSSAAEQDSSSIRSVVDLEAAGRKIKSLGPKWVLVKGGHLPLKADLTAASTPAEREVVVDVLVGPGEEDVVRLQRPWMESSSTHGTGCSLACKSTVKTGYLRS
jgi:hydroxymethylpyrimidine/phosphomethylpyrimidine kinase